MFISQSQIIEAIIAQADEMPDRHVQSVLCGPHMVAVKSDSNTGLCSRLSRPILQQGCNPNPSDSVRAMTKNFKCQNTINASWGLAAINSLLNKGATGPEIKVQELINSLGRDKNVAIIGHFPFVENMGKDFRKFWVLELVPRGTDIPENMKNNILPRADLVAITATTLLNGTLGEILSLSRKNAVRIMLGPSTPLATCLLDMGLDYLGGTWVTDHQKVFTGIKKGLPFRRLDGVSYTIMSKAAA